MMEVEDRFNQTTHDSNRSPFLPVFRSLIVLLSELSLSIKALSLSTVTEHRSRERNDCLAMTGQRCITTHQTAFRLSGKHLQHSHLALRSQAGCIHRPPCHTKHQQYPNPQRRRVEKTLLPRSTGGWGVGSRREEGAGGDVF